MGQQEILELLEIKPRLCQRDIACFLNWNIGRTFRNLHKLIKTKDIIADNPTQEELKKILEKYPHSIYGIKIIKVYSLNNGK